MCHFQSSLFTFSVYNLDFISVQTLDGDPHRGSRSTLQLGLSKTLMSFAISSLSPLSDSSTIRRQNPNSWGPSASFFSFFSAPAFFHRSFPSLLYHRLKETTSKAVPAKVTTIGAVAVRQIPTSNLHSSFPANLLPLFVRPCCHRRSRPWRWSSLFLFPVLHSQFSLRIASCQHFPYPPSFSPQKAIALPNPIVGRA